jgi:molecular chaperone GrpE
MNEHPERDEDGPLPPDDAPAPNGPVQATQDDPASLRRERDELRDQLLRSRADFANYQKRARAQADSDRAYAVGNLATDLLTVLDDLERALDAARGAGADSITAGLELVQKHLLGTLAKHGVEPITALGRPFDPNEHEAIAQQPDPKHPEGTVVGELSRGYKLRDRVLRPSRVAVSTKGKGA